MKTPMDNLEEPHFQPSSLKPGVSGESVNAPYGPKSDDECGIDSVKSEYNSQSENRAPHNMNPEPTIISGLSEPKKDESSVKP